MRAKIVWFCAAAANSASSSDSSWAPVMVPLDAKPNLGTDLFRDAGIVAGGYLDLDAQRGQLRQ